MNSIFIVVQLDENDSVIKHVSAHPNRQSAASAERYYRMFDGRDLARERDIQLLTDVIEVEFSA